MGRSFEVRRKPENLPVVGYTLVVFSRAGTLLDFRYSWHELPVANCNRKSKIIILKLRNRRFSRGNGGFFIGTPSRLGPDRKERRKKRNIKFSD
jgi:hypothetical protein